MGRGLRVLPLLAVAALFLAGCSGKASEGKVLPSVAPNAQYDATHGAIKGQVIDVEQLPVGGVDLLVRPSNQLATSAADGGFTFSMLDPGKYTVYASRVGFKSPQVQVDVVAGEVTPLDVVLEPIPVAHPRTEIVGPYDGYMQCRMSTSLSSGACGFLPLVGDPAGTAGILWPNDKNRLVFKLSGDDFSYIVFEAKWTPSTAATNPKMTMIFSYDKRVGTHWFANATPGQSPLQFVHKHGKQGPGGQHTDGHPDLPDANLTLWTWLTLPFGTTNVGGNDVHPVNVAYELRFQLAVTMFYQQAVPKGYSAFPPS